MPHYLQQVAYSDEGWEAVLDNPQNRIEAVRPAIAIAFAGGGACKSVHTTPLMSPDEAVQALKKARECGYRPATTASRAA
jgi:hypothetical protein